MGKISNILASSQKVQKLYQCMEAESVCRGLPADVRVLAMLQRTLASKVLRKLPSWAAARCLFTRRALEQCSSEALAAYKASLYQGELCVDLSGGLGVDTLALAAHFKQVVSADPDEDLHALFAFNSLQMGVGNVRRVQAEAATLLQELDSAADLVYLDPDRRDKEGSKRLVGFRNYSPDPIALFHTYGHLGKVWLVKLSPLDDLQAIAGAVAGLKHIRVLSKDGEVKELLLEMIPGYAGVIEISAVFFEQNISLSYAWNPEAKAERIPYAVQPLEWLFEPAAALIKSGYLKNSRHPLLPLNASGTLWTARSREQIPGRWVRLFSVNTNCSLRKLKKLLQERDISSGLVKSRDFPLSSEQARTVLGLAEGEAYAVYLTTQGKTSLMMIGSMDDAHRDD